MPRLALQSSRPLTGIGVVGIFPALYPFVTHTFTVAGRVGRYGPTQMQLLAAYSGIPWVSNAAYFSQGRAQGYQVWTVPQTGIYTIEVAGARGQNSASIAGNYGRGAIIRARVSLTAGTKLEMVVGQVPGNGGSTQPGNSFAGAGGGSFVAIAGSSIPVIVAGGGGGSYSTYSSQAIVDGQTRRQPRWDGYNFSPATLGTDPQIGYGGPGYHGGGGGGFLGHGTAYPGRGIADSAMATDGGGQQYTSGAGFIGTSSGSTLDPVPGTWYALGGNATNLGSEGGFGGGGGGHSGNNTGGAGGGYTGGLGGQTSLGGSIQTGTGGGSYIIPSATAVATSTGQYDDSVIFNGASIANLSTNNDNGYISITLFSAAGGTAPAIPEPQLWYKNSSISILSNGASISTWANSGTYGAGYNLTSGSGLGAAVPTKQVDSGNAAAFFDGNKFLRFSNQTNITFFPTNQFKQWTIFVVYRDSSGAGNFGFLGRYGADGTNGSIGMWPSGTANNFNQIHTNDGFPVNFAMPDDGAKLQRGLRWGTSASNDGTITYWDGTVGTSSTTWSVYSSDLLVGGIGTARTTYNTGYLYELILYERALTDTEIAVVRSYLNTTFGV